MVNDDDFGVDDVGDNEDDADSIAADDDCSSDTLRFLSLNVCDLKNKLRLWRFTRHDIK